MSTWNELNVDSQPRPHTKINSRWIINLNVNGARLKLLENNARSCLQIFAIGKDFLNRSKNSLTIN